MKSLVRPELAARWAALWQAGVSLARTCLLSPAAGKPVPRSAGLQGRAGAGAAPLTTPRGAAGPGRYRADVGANPGLSCRLALASASSCAPGPVRGTCGVIASLSPLARDCRPLGHLEGRGRGGVVAFPGHEPQLCIRALCPTLSPGCPRAPSCPLFCEDTTPMNCHWPSPGIHGDHSGHGHACPPAYPCRTSWPGVPGCPEGPGPRWGGLPRAGRGTCVRRGPPRYRWVSSRRS